MKRITALFVMMQLIIQPEITWSQDSAEAEPAAAVSASPDELKSVAELSWSLRSQLPEISVIGWRSSDDDTKRFARINGEVYIEGDDLEGGLKLLHINKKDLVFMFKGTRFRYIP